MLVHKVMTRPVVCISPEATVADALELMLSKKVDGLPIVDDDNRVVGIITIADLLRRVRRQHPLAFGVFFAPWYYYVEGYTEAAERVKRLLEMPVTEVCTHTVITCGPDGHVADVAGLMVDYRIKRVPVVEEDGRLVGIVSRSDIMRALWERYGKKPVGDHDEEGEESPE